MPSLSTTLRWLGVAALVIGYPVLAHYSTSTSAATDIPDLGVSVSIAPTLAVLIWMTWNAPRRGLMLALCLAAGLGLWATWPLLRSNFDWLYYLQHVGTNLGLAAFFGLSLRQGHQPLISRLAQSIRGELTPQVETYTRKVTWVWTAFFLGIAVLSSVLFFFAPIKVWSIFANFLTLPLALLVFAIEFMVRLRYLQNEPRHSFKESLLAYWKTADSRQGSANAP